MNAKTNLSKGASPADSMIWNFKQIAQHELEGFGGVGEGIGVQIAPDGRRILWLGHESAPKNFTAVDVTDPRKPKMILQTDLPHNDVRSNSLEVCGNMLCVAYQTRKTGMKPAGFDLFDISIPEKPQLMSHFDRSGPHSRGVHAVWLVDGEFVHMASGAADFQPHDPRDDQCYMIVDIRNPTKPVEAGRWWAPGTRVGDSEASPRRVEGGCQIGVSGFRAHNTNVFPQRPDRAYVGYLDYGAVILDIADKAHPKVISRWSNCPPHSGFNHTALPLFSRDLMLVSDESTKDNAADWPKLVWVLDIKVESSPLCISTLPLPDKDTFAKRGGRFGAHNLHENYPGASSWRSDNIVFGTFFNGGLRAYDLTNPYQPQEIAYFVPGAPKMSRAGAVQLNDIFVDDRGIVYTVDRFTGGVYILEMNF